MKRSFTMIVEAARDRKGQYFGASFPELPGCYTMGGTLRELRANAREAIRLHLEGLKETHQAMPWSGIRVDHVEVTLPAQKRARRAVQRSAAARHSQAASVLRLGPARRTS
jgi:predicted RNase H-like HicB family nuclease